jgi:hypothetical protein
VSNGSIFDADPDRSAFLIAAGNLGAAVLDPVNSSS